MGGRNGVTLAGLCGGLKVKEAGGLWLELLWKELKCMALKVWALVSLETANYSTVCLGELHIHRNLGNKEKERKRKSVGRHPGLWRLGSPCPVVGKLCYGATK